MKQLIFIPTLFLLAITIALAQEEPLSLAPGESTVIHVPTDSSNTCVSTQDCMEHIGQQFDKWDQPAIKKALAKCESRNWSTSITDLIGLTSIAECQKGVLELAACQSRASRKFGFNFTERDIIAECGNWLRM